MKHFLILLLTALLGFTFTACTNSDTTSVSGVMVVNPMQEKTSLTELNAAIGCAMKSPAGITVSEERFFVISGTIAEYRFTAEGISYTLRASADKGDISGIHVNGTTLGDAANAANGAAETAVFESGMWTRWFDGDMQYSLVSDETGTADTSTLYRVRDALR
jgi:hypothetical protein